MKIKKTEQLNELYSSSYTEDEAIDQLIYLTNKSRGNHISEKKLRIAYREERLGEILKKYDPVAYNLEKTYG